MVKEDSTASTLTASVPQKSLLGRRIVNIYDGNSPGRLVHFQIEGDSSSGVSANMNNTTDVNNATGTGKFFLLSSGISLSTPQHYSAESPMPTPFARETAQALTQLRWNKCNRLAVIASCFCSLVPGSSKHAIILELYAKGNIVLVDTGTKYWPYLRSHVYKRAMLVITVLMLMVL
jgi:hypothetical protein